MKILYFDCAMGAAGDMLMAALLELHPAKEDFLARLNAALAGKAVVSASPDVRRGICGTHVSVVIDGEEEGDAHGGRHRHTGVKELLSLIDGIPADEKTRADARAVYSLIADAESRVHGAPMENIHFHELGSLDALADVVGVCMLINELAPGLIAASPVHVGCGTVNCAHGVLPVPAPATELLLRGVPIYGGETEGELCTPTGAALLKHFCARFGAIPAMRVTAAGYGTGRKDFANANVVRALLGESGDGGDEALELRCNLDDMTPEELGFAQEELFRAGALDVYTIALGMKKSRPGVLLCCLCRESEREAVVRAMFKNTTTLGIRESLCRRYTLDRGFETVETGYGAVSVKTASGWGVSRRKGEYEQLARIARDTGRPLREIENELEQDRRK